MEGGTGHTTRLIVVDASVVVSAALRPSGLPRQALDQAIERERIVLSRPVLEEMREVLGRRKFSSVLTPGAIDEIVSAVSTAAMGSQWQPVEVTRPGVELVRRQRQIVVWRDDVVPGVVQRIGAARCQAAGDEYPAHIQWLV